MKDIVWLLFVLTTYTHTHTHSHKHTYHYTQILPKKNGKMVSNTPFGKTAKKVQE